MPGDSLGCHSAPWNLRRALLTFVLRAIGSGCPCTPTGRGPGRLSLKLQGKVGSRRRPARLSSGPWAGPGSCLRTRRGEAAERPVPREEAEGAGPWVPEARRWAAPSFKPTLPSRRKAHPCGPLHGFLAAGTPRPGPGDSPCPAGRAQARMSPPPPPHTCAQRRFPSHDDCPLRGRAGGAHGPSRDARAARWELACLPPPQRVLRPRTRGVSVPAPPLTRRSRGRV